LREGVTLGIIVATTTWLWVAIVDLMAGHAFHAFEALGGIAAFTVAHYLLNIVFGVVIVSAVRGAERAPSVILAVVFGLVMLEVAFAMVTVLLTNLGVGTVGWIGIFGGSLVGTALALAILARRYPLATRLREAEEEK
jgi:hypothetical protein